MRNWVKSTLIITLMSVPLGIFAQDGAAPKAQKSDSTGPKEDAVPEGQELVNIDFPEPTDINDIIRAVSRWTGKNVILGKGVSGKVQMISPTKVTKEEAYQAFLSALNVLKLTTVETGKIIKIMQTRSAMKDNLQILQGSNWAPRTDKMITQIVPLRYIDAKKLQTTLSRIVTTNSMIAYPPTNTLIISDTGYKVRRILTIIELLDVQGQQPQVALVPIRYADAKQVSQKVADILKASKEDASKDGGAKYKISVDERSNSVVIFGPPRTIADVKALVRKFDFPIDDPANQASIRVRFLNYADAKKLATTLSSLAQGKGNANSANAARNRLLTSNLDKVNPGGTLNGGPIGAASSEPLPVASLGGNVKITADESSNALLVTGSRSAYEAVNNLVRKLDQRRAQVYFEVDIIDVKVTDDFLFQTSIFAGDGSEKGTKMSYGWQGSAGIAPLIAAQQATPQDGSNLSPEIASKAVGALGKDFTVGILSGQTVNVPGLGKVTPGGLITMIKKDQNTRILSSPHLLTSNNEIAKIVVGQKLFYQTASETALGAAGSVPKVEKEDVDLTLEIKPNISHTGEYVTVKIDLEANDGGINNGGVPDINKRHTSQIVTLKSGQTAVISGLIKNFESEGFSKIPLLGDIPILGWLFRNTTKSKYVTNLMFFITPHIVYGANDLAQIYQNKLTENNSLMEKYFDNDETENEWLKRSPKLADGQFVPSTFDNIEYNIRQKYLNEMRSDMGFTAKDLEQFQVPGQATEINEKPASSAAYSGGGELNFNDDGQSNQTNGFEAPPLLDAPAPPEAPEPPEPPPPPEESFDNQE